MLAASIYQARSVRDELPFEHDLSHGPLEVRAFGLLNLCISDVINYASDNVVPLFDRSTLLVFSGVAFTSYLLGIKSKRWVVC